MTLDPNVELNVDLGEHEDEPDELYSLAHRVNVACGGHAGDDASMRRALRLARAHDCRVGAHPSYPDREGFGRRSLEISVTELSSSIHTQCMNLARLADELGVRVLHVKLHGALYHDAHRAPGLALRLADAATKALGEVALVGPPDGGWHAAARQLGIPYFVEGFADRRYRADGTLVPRTEPGALITAPEEAAAQVRRLVDLARYDTLCVHADTPGAVEVARAVRKAIDEVRA
jgi:UPF0271 protein